MVLKISSGKKYQRTLSHANLHHTRTNRPPYLLQGLFCYCITLQNGSVRTGVEPGSTARQAPPRCCEVSFSVKASSFSNEDPSIQHEHRQSIIPELVCPENQIHFVSNDFSILFMWMFAIQVTRQKENRDLVKNNRMTTLVILSQC